MKARFLEPQPPVRWQPLENGSVDIAICLNERMETVSYENEGRLLSEEVYAYDYNQFRTDELTREEVEAEPEKYLSYNPQKVESQIIQELLKRVSALEEQKVKEV